MDAKSRLPKDGDFPVGVMFFNVPVHRNPFLLPRFLLPHYMPKTISQKSRAGGESLARGRFAGIFIHGLTSHAVIHAGPLNKRKSPVFLARQQAVDGGQDPRVVRVAAAHFLKRLALEGMKIIRGINPILRFFPGRETGFYKKPQWGKSKRLPGGSSSRRKLLFKSPDQANWRPLGPFTTAFAKDGFPGFLGLGSEAPKGFFVFLSFANLGQIKQGPPNQDIVISNVTLGPGIIRRQKPGFIKGEFGMALRGQ